MYKTSKFQKSQLIWLPFRNIATLVLVDAIRCLRLVNKKAKVPNDHISRVDM